MLKYNYEIIKFEYEKTCIFQSNLKLNCPVKMCVKLFSISKSQHLHRSNDSSVHIIIEQPLLPPCRVPSNFTQDAGQSGIQESTRSIRFNSFMDDFTNRSGFF